MLYAKHSFRRKVPKAQIAMSENKIIRSRLFLEKLRSIVVYA